MYARITHFQADPAKLDALGVHVGRVAEQVRKLPGARAVYASWRADGSGVVSAYYDDEAAAEKAAPQAQELWASMAEYMTAPPEAEGYDIVVQMKG